jgi:hypothetical protein
VTENIPGVAAFIDDLVASVEGVSELLIPWQMGRPNLERLMKSPITRACMVVVVEKHLVRRTRRLIRVRKVRGLRVIFGVCSLPT